VSVADWLQRMRRSLGDQGGMTLTEMMVVLMLLSIVLLVFTDTLASVQRTVVEEEVRSDLNNDARLALQSFDRIVRSGNVL
jgi:prepilin-type N-terminal cleavage/methylation domain-containing protein